MSFEEFYNYSYRSVFIYFYNRVDDKSSVDDLCQEVYIRFYQKSFNDNENFTENHIKILFGFCRNICKENFRSVVKNKTVEFFDDYDYSEFLESEIDENENNNSDVKDNQKNLVAKALSSLHERTRLVIEYRFFYEMSRKAIANLLGMNERDVLKYQQRGIKYIKKLLENDQK